MDHKIKEFRNQMEPKEIDIARMKETVEKLGRELGIYYSRNTEITTSIADTVSRKEIVAAMYKQERNKSNSVERMSNSLKIDIDASVHFQGYYEVLCDKMKQILIKNGVENEISDKTAEMAVIMEWQTQKDQLMKETRELKREIDKTFSTQNRTSAKSVRENMKLIEYYIYFLS